MQARLFYELEGSVAERYDSESFWNRRYHCKRAKIIAKILSTKGVIRDSDVILDVGCGSGELSKMLKHFGSLVVGLDVSSSYLDRAKGSADGLVQGTLEMLPFRQRAFDFVLCADVIEHVHSFDESATELFRVSKRNILITAPNEGFLRGLFVRIANAHLQKIDALVGHKHIFPLFLLCRKLIRHGWKISYSRSFHVLQPLADKMLPPKVKTLIDFLEKAADVLIPYQGTVSAILFSKLCYQEKT